MTSPVELLVTAQARDIGAFAVRRLLPAAARRSVGPFVFFDHFGPVDLPPGQGMDVRPHPHIGLATVTYLFAGSILHRDSLGCVQEIRPGDVNWMTAGRGIVHSERSPEAARRAGGPMHGIQTWAALPRDHEESEPSFYHHAASTLPDFTHAGVHIRVVAGNAFGVRSPVAVYADTLYCAAEMAAGASFALPPEHRERAVYVAEGQVLAGGEPLPVHSLAVLREGGTVELKAGTASKLMLLGGAPLDGPRFMWWNFVSSRRERIERAKLDWAEGRFTPVPGDSDHIPLPMR